MTAASLDLLKTLLGDTDESNRIMSDPEYEAAIVIETELYRAAALCCKMMAARYAQIVNINVGGSIEYGARDKFNHYMDLAKQYLTEAQTGVSAAALPKVLGISKTAMEAQREETDRVQPAFRRDQHTNPPLTEEIFEESDG